MVLNKEYIGESALETDFREYCRPSEQCSRKADGHGRSTGDDCNIQNQKQRGASSDSVRRDEMKNIEQAESYFKRAWTKLDEAREHLRKWNYAESVSASQESIEFSVKALFLAYSITFPKSHDVRELPFVELMQRIPASARDVYNFPRVLLFARFWYGFYLVAKYGFEELKVGADKLFGKEEAELASKHAQEAYDACNLPYQRIRWPR